MEHRWNDTAMAKPTYSRKKLPQRHFVYDKYIRTVLELNPRLIGERLDNVLMLQCCDSDVWFLYFQSSSTTKAVVNASCELTV
jgi:hypothetical protein